MKSRAPFLRHRPCLLPHGPPLAVVAPRTTTTVGQHLKGVGAVVFLNLCLVAGADVETAADVISKEGVLFCVILFVSLLAALRTVITTRLAASIPQVHDFNIYFPTALGLLCAVTLLALKGLYRNPASDRSPGTQELRR